MYNEQITQLIEAALIDGNFTEKEKQILLNKAKKQGVDIEEFEIILEGRLYEKKQSLKKLDKQEITPSKTDKFGEIRKCPACGSIIGSFQAFCIACGYEFSNVQVSNSIQKLYNELMRVEQEEINKHDSTNLSDINLKQNIWIRKSSVLSSFPISNTKEDILEFLTLAISCGKKAHFFDRVKMNPEELNYIKTWRLKAEQVIIKAKFSFKNDTDLLEEIEFFDDQLRIKWNWIKLFYKFIINKIKILKNR